MGKLHSAAHMHPVLWARQDRTREYGPCRDSSSPSATTRRCRAFCASTMVNADNTGDLGFSNLPHRHQRMASEPPSMPPQNLVPEQLLPTSFPTAGYEECPLQQYWDPGMLSGADDWEFSRG